MDLLVNRETGDLVYSNGKCPVSKDEGDVVAQRLYIRLRTFLTEWFLDRNYGVPYGNILGNKVSKAKADQILQTEILSVEGVSEIFEWSSNIDKKRVYSCQFRVKTTHNKITNSVVITPSGIVGG